MTQGTARQRRRVPRFANEQEAAAFWDTHSPLDYPEEFREVEVKFAKPAIKRGLTVKLDQDTVDQVTALANRQGVGPTTLIRMWVLEHLRAEQSRQERP
jgi:hypothetical protein